nr:MAG TPA: hypothetical protein [Caudoviricetes sp.]
MGKIIRGYKGFERDFTCRGMQYEVGKTYEIEGEPKLCERGFHFCTSPLAVFDYYDPTNRFAIVKADEDDVIYDATGNSHKAVARRITIVREITLDKIVSLQMEFSSTKKRPATGGEMCRLGDEKVALRGCALTGMEDASIVGVRGGSDYCVSIDGNYAVSVSAMTFRSVDACYGMNTLAAATGRCSVAITDGVCSAAVTTQHSSVAIAEGNEAVAVATDDGSVAVACDRSAAICTGFSSVAISKEKNALAVAAGGGCMASGVLGSWLVLVDRKYSQICDVRVVRVDGKDIKEGVRYELKDGEIKEV